MIVVNRPRGDGRAVAAPSGHTATPIALQVAPTRADNPSPAATDSPLENSTTPVSHIVQSGENLFRISLAFGVSVADIMAANGLADSNTITAGQELIIPLDKDDALAAGPTATAAAGTGDLALGTAHPAAIATIAPLPSLTPSPPATSPAPDGVNGVAAASILIMPNNVRQSARQIYTRGQELGRNPAAYSKLGDSTIENPHFMARFDEGPYDLGQYAYLQDAIDYFAGSHGRQGAGVRRGFHSWTVTDPTWADKSLCLPNESSVACEIRLHDPSIMLILLGSNDAGVPGGFEQNMRQVIDITIEHGVIPVIGTKADRFEGSNINNQILRRLAAEYQIPLWDFDLVAGTIAGRGLDSDGVHLTTFYAHNYTSPTAFQRGHSLHNLTALMALDAIWREVIRESE
jgi:LysM repeat protein